MKFVVVQRTGFCPYFLYTWDGLHTCWLPRRDLAKQFTRNEAQSIIDLLNAASPVAVNPVEIEPATKGTP